MAEATKKYHIIGGGIAGLTVAQLLRQKYPNAEIIVYEAAAHCGGRCTSFNDVKLDAELDYATHVILGANRHATTLLGAQKFDGQAAFYDFSDKKIHTGITDKLEDKALALFNLPLKKTAQAIVFKTFYKLFPFTPKRLSVWFSKGDLSQKLIAPLSQNITLKTGWKLKNFHENNGIIYKLEFNKGCVAVLPQDKIITALDASNYARIFGGAEFEYNKIINIFFRTSMLMTLPKNRNFIGICGGLAQWMFASSGLLAVTISDVNFEITDEELALTVWKEACALRGHAAAFLPPHRVIHHKRATIRQDKTNNDKRPKTCQTKWKNLLICGDWTMKNWPCSIEAAMASAERVIKKL